MTRDEIIAQLRDVHLPPGADSEFGFAIAWWPLAAYTLICAVIFVVALWRRGAWRREARSRLREIEALGDTGRRWRRLLDLALAVTRARGYRDSLPEAAYRAPKTVADEDVAILSEHVRRTSRR
jgi:hypothetical protein